MRDPFGMTIPSAVVAFSVVFTITGSPALAFLVSIFFSSSPVTGRSCSLLASGAPAVLGTGTAAAVAPFCGCADGAVGCADVLCGVEGAGLDAGCCAAIDTPTNPAKARAGIRILILRIR